MLRAVLDTNIFVSGVLTRQGRAAQLLDAWRNLQFLLVISEEVIAEIEAVLKRPHLQEKYALSPNDIERLILLLRQDALVIPLLTDTSGAIPDDPADEKFLACAVDGLSDYLVSGDRHLLDLGKYQDIPIVTLSQFLDVLQGEE